MKPLLYSDYCKVKAYLVFYYSLLLNYYRQNDFYKGVVSYKYIFNA